MMRITRLFSGPTPRSLSRWPLIALPGVLLGLVFFAGSCTETPVESQVPVANTRAAEGANPSPLIEFQAFEHDPDASPKVILAVGHQHIQELLDEGKISYEEAQRSMRALEERAHVAMGLDPVDADAHERRTTKGLRQILENSRDAQDNLIIDQATLDKLTAKELAALKEAAAAHHKRIEIREDAPPDP